MSRTDDTTRETRDATSSEARGVAGMIRLMAIKLTSAPFWRTVGHLLLDDATEEARDPAMFSGIGFCSRPAAGANAEAIVTFPGGASNPVIIAARDEDARKKHAELAQDETAMFNRLVIAVIKAAGTMEIRTAAGVAAALATKADLAALKAAIVGWTPVANDGGAALKVALVALFTGPPVWPAGTTVLKAQ